MENSIDYIIHSQERLDSIFSELLDYYTEIYGEEYRPIIERRMKNTLYLFDSNPVSVMNFIQNNIDFIHDVDFLKQAEEEFINYQKIQEKIHMKFQKDYYGILSQYFSLPSHPIRLDILSLDIESFSLKNCFLLRKEDYPDSEKEKIRKRQEKYISDCKSLGVLPLTNSTYIQFLMDEKNRLSEMEQYFLLKKTKWGKRIQKKFRQYYPNIQLDDMLKVIGDSAVANTSYLLDNDSIPRARIVAFPLIQALDVRNLDRIFLHENRHVIESGPFSSGLQSHVGSHYTYINEIRTEKNAMIDVSQVPMIWSNESMNENYHNNYEDLFPFTGSFFEEYRDFLNQCAINGDLDSFEKKFGKEALISFEFFLESILQSIKNSCLEKNKKMEEGIEFVRRLQK